MAATNGTEIVLKITKSMRIGANTRALELKPYLEQLADNDAAEIRALRIDAPLSSTKAAGVWRERDDDDDWRSFRNDHIPPAKKEQIIALLDAGIPPVTIAKRCQVSGTTVYRIRQKRRKQAQSLDDTE